MELIKITEQNGQQAVSARELYDFLGFNKTQWKRWYEKNIISNPYAEENTDWQGFDIMSSGNETMDFVLSLDFAKRLSMLARTEKGEQIRNYFIACEKKLKELPLQPQQGIVTSNADYLLDLMADVCLVDDGDVRIRLTNKVLALKEVSCTNIKPTANDSTLYTDDCKQIISSAINSDYMRFLRAFMNNRSLATAASIVDLAERYVANHTVSFKRSAFFTELGREIEISNIKHLPRTYRPLRDKIRDYSHGTDIVNLIYAKNAGNQNAKR